MMKFERATDILDGSHQDLRKPLLFSVGVHVGVFSLAVGLMLVNSNPNQWGGEDFGGGAIGIAVENSVPLPQAAGIRNPLANDTESEIQPEKEKSKAEKQKEALEKLLADDVEKLQKTKPRSDLKNPLPHDPDKMTSATGNRMSNPMYGGQPGGGGVGVGSSALGNQFGAYLQAIQQRIASKWRPYELDARLKNPPPVLVSFEILRNGEVRTVRIVQSGGNQILDLSAQRAVVEAGPFEPLPQAYKEQTALIQVAFKLER